MPIAGVASKLLNRIVVLSIALCWLGLTPVAAWSQQRTGFQVREFKDDTGTHKYSVFVPRGYSPQYKWPTILFLHGAGERGTDGVLPTTIGLGPLVKLREANFPFIVVFPQHEDLHGRILTGWDPSGLEGQRALKILEQVEKDFSVDTKREILTGWSMGGFGAWQMAAAFPNRWLSVVTVSGGGDTELAEKLKSVPIWLFHGSKDNIVAPEYSRKLVEALEAAGAKPRYTEVPDGDHNVWKQTYDDEKLYAWMLYPTHDPEKLRAITSRPQPAPGQPAVEIPEAPFVPALEVNRAIYVRLGNDALTALSDSIPKIVPASALVGGLNPISTGTEAKGYSFSVYMSGLSYSAELYRASVKAYAKDRLNVQLGLRNVHVTIGGTSIEGSPGGATAGPMSVVIGHVRPVWLSFDVMPVVADRKVHLRLLGTNFHIPNDNWYVSGPAGVSLHGFGLFKPSTGEISSGLVNGIYSRKATIEQQVASVVPSLIAQMEEKLDVTHMAQGVGSIWPLPVYQPRLRLWPSEVSTDENGISLLLGVTAAAVNPGQTPRKVQSVQAGNLSLASIPHSTNLRVGLTPEVLGPLTELLVDADVARIHVADTPSKSMARLADPAVISDVIPDLKRYGDRLQTYTELVLAGPVNVIEAPAGRGATASVTGGAGDKPAQVELVSAHATRQLALDAPRVKILVSIKTDPGAVQWRPCAEFDIALRQAASPEMLKPDFKTRAVAIHWEGAAQLDVKGKFAEGYAPQNDTLENDRFAALFSAGWDEYMHKDRPAQLTLPDVGFGFTALRATDAGWSAPSLFATYGPAGVKLTNSNDKPLVYETQGPYSGWGGPYTLKPGESHEFAISYPLGFRRNTGAGYQSYTLPAGTHSEFWSPKEGRPLGLYQARTPEQMTTKSAGRNALTP